MQDSGIVLEAVVRDVLVAESGLVMKSLMVATIYRRPHPQLVLTRETSMPNATGVTVSYTLISGDTLEDWKRNLEELDSMIWKPVLAPTGGRKKN